MATAALIGAALTKAFTGENPKDTNDYIFPRVGGTNPDGSPRRLTTMFYLREIHFPRAGEPTLWSVSTGYGKEPGSCR